MSMADVSRDIGDGRTRAAVGTWGSGMAAPFFPSPGTPGEGSVRAFLEHHIARMPEGADPDPLAAYRERERERERKRRIAASPSCAARRARCAEERLCAQRPHAAAHPVFARPDASAP